MMCHVRMIQFLLCELYSKERGPVLPLRLA